MQSFFKYSLIHFHLDLQSAMQSSFIWLWSGSALWFSASESANMKIIEQNLTKSKFFCIKNCVLYCTNIFEMDGVELLTQIHISFAIKKQEVLQFNNFQCLSPKAVLSQVWLNLAKWFKRRKVNMKFPTPITAAKKSSSNLLDQVSLNLGGGDFSHVIDTPDQYLSPKVTWQFFYQLPMSNTGKLEVYHSAMPLLQVMI